jgi:hypothetical protein
MEIPDSLSERFPFLETLGEQWQPVSRGALGAWLVFYIVLLVNAVFRGTLFQWFDLVFVPIHEGGHLLFGYFGKWIMVAGGTFLQLFVPFALTVYFVFKRQLLGTTFCAFFFFEQFLPIGVYMADAQCQCLEYVTVGDAELAEHDWFYLFSRAGVLEHDTQIGNFFRVLGWIGMLGAVAWFVWRSWRSA